MLLPHVGEFYKNVKSQFHFCFANAPMPNKVNLLLRSLESIANVIGGLSRVWCCVSCTLFLFLQVCTKVWTFITGLREDKWTEVTAHFYSINIYKSICYGGSWDLSFHSLVPVNEWCGCVWANLKCTGWGRFFTRSQSVKKCASRLQCCWNGSV